MSLLARRRVLMMGGRTSPKVFRDGVWSADSGGCYGLEPGFKFPSTVYDISPTSITLVGNSAAMSDNSIKLINDGAIARNGVKAIGVRTNLRLDLAGFAKVRVTGKGISGRYPTASRINVGYLRVLPEDAPEDMPSSLLHDYTGYARYWDERPDTTGSYVPGFLYDAAGAFQLSTPPVDVDAVFDIPDLSYNDYKYYLVVTLETVSESSTNNYKYEFDLESITLE